jgi:hypothetical protein
MPTERDKLIIRIFADCGLRLDELTQLNDSDVVKRLRQDTTSGSSASATGPRRPAPPRRSSGALSGTSLVGRRTASPLRSFSRTAVEPARRASGTDIRRRLSGGQGCRGSGRRHQARLPAPPPPLVDDRDCFATVINAEQLSPIAGASPEVIARVLRPPHHRGWPRRHAPGSLAAGPAVSRPLERHPMASTPRRDGGQTSAAALLARCYRPERRAE